MAHAQTSVDELRKLLIGQPLYLRSLRPAFKVEFGPVGEPIGEEPPQGPLTLSGVDIVDVQVQGKKLVLHGQRVALVENDEGRLVRQGVINTTLMFGTYQKKYVARQL